MLQKTSLILKLYPFISKMLFLVHAVSFLVPTMLLLFIYAQYQKHDLTILLRVNAYNNMLNMEHCKEY